MFSVLHANHLEDLRDLALALTQRDRLPPLTPETFLVQSNGMAQWLRLSLAEADGIAASVDFPLPSSFVWRAYRGVLEANGEVIPKHSPFDKRPLAWRILRLLDEVIAKDPQTFAPLAHYLRSESSTALPNERETARGERQRWQLALRLADLFDQYLNYRPDWLAAWESQAQPGESNARFTESAPADLADDQLWQPALWRALIADAEVEAREHHRARLHGRFLLAARALETRPAELPPRLFVFGISTLPAQTLEALHALSGVIDVFLMITNPCRHYWGDIVSDREAIKRAGRLSRQALARQQERHPEAPWLEALDEESLHLQANPLLAAWGAQGRDFIVDLYEFESQDGAFDVETDLFHDPVGEDVNPEDAPLLNQLQQDILDLRHPGERTREAGTRRLIHEQDASLSLVRVHSPLREVEVLHDRLLAAFEQASTLGDALRPRDILVMVPEIDIYAPYIEAVFGRLPFDDPHHIPFTIADQVASEAHPLMTLVLSLLELPERRLGVSELLDALDVPAFRQRFAMTEFELPRLRRWLEESGVRWGLSGEHRLTLGFPAVHENSWSFGLERMLLGYATGSLSTDSPGQFDGVVPYDEVGGLEADLAGRLAELVRVIDAQRQALSEPAKPGQWLIRLRDMLGALLSPTALDEHDVLARVDQALDRWQQSCELAAFDQPIELVVLRDALKSELDDGGLAQRFLAGKVNFATLMPMRAIPFRQVYLLGMSDGAYPRTRQPQDFDLMAQRPRPGDRSRRDDDRYLLLEALLSARERLTLSWVGFDQRDNTPRPPSVLINELLDTLEQGWLPAGANHSDPEQALAARLIEDYPLQPFSQRYFLADDSRFTFDASWEALHLPDSSPESLAAPPVSKARVEGGPDDVFGDVPTDPLSIADLTRLLRRPWSVYLRRLGVHFQDAEGPDEDNEPFVLEALEGHTLKRELLDAGRREQPLAHKAEQLRLAGRLPAAGFGLATVEPVIQRLSTQLACWRHWTDAAKAVTPKVWQFLVEMTAPQAPALMLEERIDDLYCQARQDQEALFLVTLEVGHFGHFRPGGSSEKHSKATSDANEADSQGAASKGPASKGPWKQLGKPHRLHAGYLRWLLVNANVSEGCRWIAIFEDRWIEFPALAPAQAQQQLRDWVSAWWHAWRAPLPANGELIKELWAYTNADTLAELAAGEPLEASLRERLVTRYETGDARMDALIQREGGLGQLWPSFAAFEASGGIQASVRHYQPLLEALLSASQRSLGAWRRDDQRTADSSPPATGEPS